MVLVPGSMTGTAADATQQRLLHALSPRRAACREDSVPNPWLTGRGIVRACVGPTQQGLGLVLSLVAHQPGGLRLLMLVFI